MNRTRKTVFEKKSMKNSYILEWLNLLCDTKDRYELFINQFMDDTSIFYSACNFQKYLREHDGRGKDISQTKLTEAIKRNDDTDLKNLLSELFLEPIRDDEIEYLVELEQNNMIKIEDFYEFHMKNLEKGFWMLLKKLVSSKYEQNSMSKVS